MQVSNTLEGIIIKAMLKSFAEYYSAELSQKVKHRLKESRIKGLFIWATPYGNGSKCQFENGASAPQFEPFAKITKDNSEKGEAETEVGETGTVNDKVETKNKKRGRSKTKNKVTPQTTQKFSNHIKFIDYIPTHEIITYRHLFAYGFYVE